MLISYQLNKEYLTKVFCVNKSKPQLHCNGKCYLKKQLDVKQDQEENNSATINFDKLPEIFWLPQFTKTQNHFLSSATYLFSFNKIFLSLEYTIPCFHPPALKA